MTASAAPARAHHEARDFAIAGVLIRADYTVLARAELVQTLREHRRSKVAHSDDVIEALIRQLQQ